MTAETALAPPLEPLSEDRATYRWVLISSPEGSAVTDPQGGATVTFTPDKRGNYLIERWLSTGLSEDLTYRFAIEALGLPPVARLYTDEIAAGIGAAVDLDGSGSTSVEQFDLTYKWRLVSRPRTSNATITNPAAPIITFVPDVGGWYRLELEVFDGELWSLRPAEIGVYAL